jgi:hypothetical protein
MPENRVEPPPDTTPITVPGDTTLLLQPGLIISVGAVRAWPQGFEFTLSMLTSINHADTVPPESIALYPKERGSHSWLSVRYADGRERSADLNANTPFEQPEGPHLRCLYAESSDTDGWDQSQWWVTPLPPPGPVQITIHLGGRSEETGSGHLDGQLIAEAGVCAQLQVSTASLRQWRRTARRSPQGGV